MLASTLRCVMTTPLGSAVAPDVKMISAVSSRVTDARRRRCPWRCQSSSVQAPHVGGPSRRARTPRLPRRSAPAARSTMRGDAPQEVGRGAVVDGHGDDALEQAAPERGNPLGPVLRPEDDRVALAEAGRVRAARQRRGRRAPRRRRCAPSAGSRCRRRGTRREARRGRRRSRAACHGACAGL